MTRLRIALLRASSAMLLATGIAAAAAFGPEAVKTVVPPQHETWRFTGLTAAAFALIGIGLLLRRRHQDLDTATIVASAIDPHHAEAGRAFHASSQAHAARISPMPVVPYAVHLDHNRATAAAQVDDFGRRINELVSMAEVMAPSARRINLLITARNAAAFRLGMQLGRNHRKDIVLHHADARGHNGVLRLAGRRATLNGLTTTSDSFGSGPGELRGCLLLNVTGKHEITRAAAERFCIDHQLRFLVEIHYTGDHLPTTRKAFEAIVATAVQGWQRHRPANARGPSAVLLDCPAVIATGLGAQLAIHGDGPWIPYEFDHGTYTAFTPGAA